MRCEFCPGKFDYCISIRNTTSDLEKVKLHSLCEICKSLLTQWIEDHKVTYVEKKTFK